jgi:uncharacterized protein GlcG (DUF336 family)
MGNWVEGLEGRRLLSAAPHASRTAPPPPALDLALTVGDVQTVIAQAASQALTTQAIVVVDREGTILAIYGSSGVGADSDPVSSQIVLDAALRARTAAAFESSGEAFTSRTARFIIQDHFPWPINNTPGGPLYGVEFSSLANSDVLLSSQTPAISGDPGGIPLYKDGVPVGAVGVAGDFHDVAARPDFIALTQAPYDANPRGLFFNGTEERDTDEAVALAGAQGFMAPQNIRATNIFIDGLRLPFTAEPAAHGHPVQTFDQLIAEGAGSIRASSALGNSTTIIAGSPEIDNATIAGVPGLLRMHSNLGQTDPQASDPIVGAQDGQANGLTADDVTNIIQDAVQQAIHTRAGIRQPVGSHAVVHVVVTDLSGNVLGAFRMHDGTNFSYDVAVQKARTAAFFSDDQHAFSTRAVGFMAQAQFPPGIPRNKGPLYQLQDQMDVNNAPGVLNPNFEHTPLADGITIFPGGFPLYKNGVLVGGVGVSGDGVDQDDIISYAGTQGFRPAAGIESDQLTPTDITSFIVSKVQQINAMGGINFDTNTTQQRMDSGLPHVRLPYAKFPRNPSH